MLAISGRADGESEDSNSSTQVWINNVHNASENPNVGRSGRFPLRIFCITAASELACSKGLRPVTTCRGEVMSRDRSSRSGEPRLASRIVIPKAYMSVLFDGSFLRTRLTYPDLSGSRMSGAIHRIVPPVLWPLAPSTELSSMIATSPKSARQAWNSEFIRMLACRSSPVNLC